MNKVIFIVLGICLLGYAQGNHPDSSFVGSDSIRASYQISKEDINHLPVRDVPNYLKTLPGVQLEQGDLFIRGGSEYENQTMINGAYLVTPNKYSNSLPDMYTNGLHIIPSALESVTLKPGNYDAAYGWGNSALIDNRLRTGRPDFHTSLEFQTDKVVKQGENFLGTTSFGDHFLTLTLEGSLFKDNNRFFIAYENEDIGDSQKMFNDGFNLENRVDMNPSNPNVGQDTVDVVFPAGYTPKNRLNRHSVNARLDFNYEPVSFSLTGLYSHVEDYQLLTTAQDVFNDREQPHIGDVFYGSGEITWKINDKSRLKLQGGYLYEKHERQDDYFGNNWRLWSDSAAVARHTDNEVIYRNAYCSQYNYQLNGFYFIRNGTLNYDYSLLKNQAFTGRVEFQTHFRKYHNFTIGIEANQTIMRYYSVDPCNYLYYLDEYGSGNEQDIPIMMRYSFVRPTIGYDYFGNESNELHEPIKDLTGAFYLSDNFRWRRFQFDLGLRMDFHKRLNKDLYLKNPFDPIVDPETGMVIMDVKEYKAQIKLNPRIGIVYNLSDILSFNASYNQHVQQNMYFGPSNYDFHYSNQFEISTHAYIPGIGCGTISLFKRKSEFEVSSIQKEEKNIKGVVLRFNSLRFSRFIISFNYTYLSKDAPPETKYISAIYRGIWINFPEKILRNHLGNIILDYRFLENDGGKIFSNSGVSLLLNFSSGDDYTIYSQIGGQLKPSGYDYVNLYPFEFVGNDMSWLKTTPWIYTIDLKIDKSFKISSKLSTTLYLRVTNLLNTQNELNVYPYSGRADDDGYFDDPLSEVNIQMYGGQDYIEMYRAVNLQGGRSYWSQTGTHLYGNPRQIMFGVKISY